MITVKDLIAMLQKYPDDMDVRLEFNKRVDAVPLSDVWTEHDDTVEGTTDYVVLSYS